MACGRYKERLIEERKEKENNELENQKVHLMQDLNNVKGKKVTLENTIKSHFDEIMECMRLAEGKVMNLPLNPLMPGGAIWGHIY